MIPATELRIGNKFISNLNNVETVACIICNTGFDARKIVNPEESHIILSKENRTQFHFLPFQINGVPLTEQLLLNAGFNQSKVIEKSYRGKYCGFIKENIIGNFFYEENCFEYNLGKKQTQYKFLHELQNLYFALTGIELQIK